VKFPNILELQRERDQNRILNEYKDYSIIQKKDITKLFRDFYRLKNDRDIEEGNLDVIRELVETMEGGNML